MSTPKKEKKPIAFASSIAPLINAFLSRVVEDGTWQILALEEKEKKIQVIVKRYNTLTNAFPVRRKEKGAEDAAVSRSRKNANAYFYTVLVRSVIFNNVDRTYLIGVDKIWRVEAESPVEIDGPELSTLEQCIKDVVDTPEISITPFKKNRSKTKEEVEEEEEEEEEEDEDVYEGLVEEEEEEDEDEDDEEEDEPERKRMKIDTAAILEALQQNAECQKTMIECMKTQMTALCVLIERTESKSQ